MNIPNDIKIEFIKEFDSIWKNRSNMSWTENSIRDEIIVHSGYSLKMFWLGRFDKINTAKLPLLDWLTKEFISKDLVADYVDYKSGLVQFKGANHSLLADEVIKKAFEVYRGLSGVNLPKENVSGLRKLFKFMK